MNHLLPLQLVQLEAPLLPLTAMLGNDNFYLQPHNRSSQLLVIRDRKQLSESQRLLYLSQWRINAKDT